MKPYIGLLIAVLALHASGATAAELVQVDTVAVNTRAKPLLGYLAKPDGAGPFPAVVVLHGCNGFSPAMPAMADRLRSWGYVALAIDSLGPRGQNTACTGGTGIIRSQPIDAYAGLNFLAAQAFVDPERIGVLGYSMGGGSALLAAENGGIERTSPRKFRVVIAYYPICEIAGTMSVPTLVLIGALDDWTPAQACQKLAERGASDGAPIELVVYPNAYHGFDLAIARPGLRYFGHWFEYDETAATDSLMRVHQFLDAHVASQKAQ